MSTKKNTYSFTIKDYFKYLKVYYLFIVIFALIGVIGSLIYISINKATYSATAKIIVYNAEIDQGSPASPYMQFRDIFMSDIILEEKIGISDASTHLDVKELTRGVFVITDTESSADEAVNNIKKISDNIGVLIQEVYSNHEAYEVSILSLDDQATPSTSVKKNIFTCIAATLGMVFLAAIILFIKFDFAVEK